MKKKINILLTAAMLTSCIAVPLAANAADTQPSAVQNAETEEKQIISEKLKNDIDAGLEKIDVMMWCTFKIDYSKIHPEVNKATEEYKNSLDTSVYSAEDLNTMAGAFKEKIYQKMYQEAYSAKTKEVCDFIGIDVLEADFTGNALRCSLTPEQIYKIAGTDLVKGRVIEQSEFVSAEDLGYDVVLADVKNTEAELIFTIQPLHRIVLVYPTEQVVYFQFRVFYLFLRLSVFFSSFVSNTRSSIILETGT